MGPVGSGGDLLVDASGGFDDVLTGGGGGMGGGGGFEVPYQAAAAPNQHRATADVRVQVLEDDPELPGWTVALHVESEAAQHLARPIWRL